MAFVRFLSRQEIAKKIQNKKQQRQDSTSPASSPLADWSKLVISAIRASSRRGREPTVHGLRTNTPRPHAQKKASKNTHTHLASRTALAPPPLS